MREQLLDVRSLEPPEPLEHALQAATALEPGERLRMIHRREPCLLYPLLERQGFAHDTRAVAEDHYEILIWRKEEPAG